MIEAMRNKFKDLFDVQAEVSEFAPGRINLIGEHTDYNGGYVFPAAIELGTYGLAARRNDKLIRLYSNNFENIGMITLDLDNLVFEKDDDWANYPKGVIKYLKE